MTVAQSTSTSAVAVSRYESGAKDEWNRFVAASRNGTFLFHRDYVEYHADRFPDASLLFRVHGTLVAVLPATVQDTVCISHAGLTYGGVVSGTSMKTQLMLDVFGAAKAHLRSAGIDTLIYKAVPHIYHRSPAEEDLYALYINHARLVRRDMSSTLRMDDRPPLRKGRRGALKLAQKQGLAVRQSTDFRSFLQITARLLETKYGYQPVHTADEMALLAARFPHNIKLFAAFRQEEMLAGVIVYESACVAHAQYIAANDEGKKYAALDLIMDHLLTSQYRTKRFFDYGVSTERAGRDLNVGMIKNKEGFGGRGIAYDVYELDLRS